MLRLGVRWELNLLCFIINKKPCRTLPVTTGRGPPTMPCRLRSKACVASTIVPLKCCVKMSRAQPRFRSCQVWQLRVSFLYQIPVNTVMQCPACKTKLDEDSIHCQRCGRNLDKARMLDLCLDLGLAAALVAFSCVVLLWLGY
jgi:hypothetical protein